MRIKQGTILSKPTCVRQICTYEQCSLVLAVRTTLVHPHFPAAVYPHSSQFDCCDLKSKVLHLLQTVDWIAVFRTPAV